MYDGEVWTKDYNDLEIDEDYEPDDDAYFTAMLMDPTPTAEETTAIAERQWAECEDNS